jgi:small-conductance mechanosensitive channel
VISDVNRAIWQVLQQNNIELPSPQRDIRIMNPDGTTKNLEKNAEAASKTPMETA